MQTWLIYSCLERTLFIKTGQSSFLKLSSSLPGEQETFVRRIFIFFIRAYQIALSPILPPSCRYEPSCSKYAIEAISHYGVLRGLIIALRRVLRCHPWCEGGYDPVEDNGLFIFEHHLKRDS